MDPSAALSPDVIVLFVFNQSVLAEVRVLLSIDEALDSLVEALVNLVTRLLSVMNFKITVSVNEIEVREILKGSCG